MQRVQNTLIGVDLFCGVGGMSLGFEQAGVSIRAAVDNEDRHLTCYQQNLPGSKTLNKDIAIVCGDDLRKEAALQNSEIDILFGGPPCQGFSLIGRRDLQDPRSELILHFARLVTEMSPRFFVLENVEGMIRGETRRKLDLFVSKTESAGYSIVNPIVTLDAAKFGLPQKRRRVFVIGYRRGCLAPRYPEPSIPFASEPVTVWDAIGDLPEVNEVQDLITGDVYSGLLGQPSEYARTLRCDGYSKTRVPRSSKSASSMLSGCQRTNHSPATIARFTATLPGETEPVSRFHRLAKEGLSPTLRAGTGPDRGSYMAPRPIHPVCARCITVREAARLHSFPDWFEFHSTKWHSFRQIGNSVPPLLARYIAITVVTAANANPKLIEMAEE